jgi:hypothetical protein
MQHALQGPQHYVSSRPPVVGVADQQHYGFGGCVVMLQ